MIKRFLLAAALTLTLTGCSFDGSFRYPCQDPANWEKAECKPPICTVNGACPVDLVGDAATDGSTVTTESGAPNE
jgi:hypothetical protein